jgi:hypothetical protein
MLQVNWCSAHAKSLYSITPLCSICNFAVTSLKMGYAYLLNRPGLAMGNDSCLIRLSSDHITSNLTHYMLGLAGSWTLASQIDLAGSGSSSFRICYNTSGYSALKAHEAYTRVYGQVLVKMYRDMNLPGKVSVLASKHIIIDAYWSC